MIDHNRAATMAAETLVKYNVKKTPVSPMHIIEQMDNVLLISFAEMSDMSGIRRSELIPAFGKCRDAVTSFHTEGGKKRYVVAYNNLLPFGIVQHALAREMAHIVLCHTESSADNEAEALCFENHLLYPRPLIHIVQATGIRFTVDVLANLTGINDQAIINIRRLPGAKVHAGLNRFVRSQFMPFFINFFDYYQFVKPKDGSALADLGSYMDGYEE